MVHLKVFFLRNMFVPANVNRTLSYIADSFTLQDGQQIYVNALFQLTSHLTLFSERSETFFNDGKLS